MAELNEKTKAMLKLIEEDADSFAQRAEMYYKKRPELISMVEDFYRTHRSLAERHDHLRIDPSTRVVRTPSRQHSFVIPKSDSVKSFDSFEFTEETCISDLSAESEVDDPEEDDDAEVEPMQNYVKMRKLEEELSRLQEENEIQKNQIKKIDKDKEELIAQLSEQKYASVVEMTKLGKELDRLRGENEIQMSQIEQKDKEKEELQKLRDEIKSLKVENENRKEEVKQKDEEKREVIRQLSSAMEMVRVENRLLKKSIMKNASRSKKWGLPEIPIFDLGKLFTSSSRSIVPL